MAVRLGALVLAVAMVVGALVFRSHRDKASRTLRLTCVEELADACNRLSRAKVTIEAAGTTADRLTALDTGEDAGLDGWLTIGPWQEMVDDARQSAGKAPVFTGKPAVLASAPLAAVVETQRSAVLLKHCGTPPKWLCIADAMTKSWQDLGGTASFGSVKGNLPDPVKSSDGVAVLGAMSDELFEGGSFDRDDDRLRGLIASLKRVQHMSGIDAMGTVYTAPAVVDLATGNGADAVSVSGRAANQKSAGVFYPESVRVKFVGVEFGQLGDTAEARDLAQFMRSNTGVAAVTQFGWSASPPGVGSTTDPGVLAALRALWQE